MCGHWFMAADEANSTPDQSTPRDGEGPTKDQSGFRSLAAFRCQTPDAGIGPANLRVIGPAKSQGSPDRADRAAPLEATRPDHYSSVAVVWARAPAPFAHRPRRMCAVWFRLRRVEKAKALPKRSSRWAAVIVSALRLLSPSPSRIEVFGLLPKVIDRQVARWADDVHLRAQRRRLDNSHRPRHQARPALRVEKPRLLGQPLRHVQRPGEREQRPADAVAVRLDADRSPPQATRRAVFACL